jgi:Cd2+/Zn2+-exporting ATPase
MSDDLRRLPFLVKLSRKTRQVINQNLFFGIIFIVVGVGASAAGLVHIVLAAMLHFAGSVIVIFNSARLVRFGEELDPHLADTTQIE